MSKLKLVSVMMLAAMLAGCGSTSSSNGNGPGGGDGPGNGDGHGGGDGPGSGDGPGNGDGPDDNASVYQFQGHFARVNRSGGMIDTTAVSRGEMSATVAENGSSASVTGSADSLNVPDATNLPRVNSENGAEFFETAGGDTFLTLYEGSEQMGGAHYQMGLYGNGDSGGIGIAGTRTSPEQVSASGVYNGAAGGFVAVQGDEEVLGWGGTSQVRLTVDNAGAHVEGDIKNIFVEGVGSPLAEVVLERAEVTGGAYDGVARLAPLTTSPGLVVIADEGDYQGAFYGENAAETAGTFQASGTLGGIGNVGVIGGFGGSKN